MKKFLLTLICALLIIPMAVFADAKVLKYHANENMVVGGYKEVWLEASGEPIKTLNEIDLDFDQNYFSISKEDISISSCGKDITDYDNISIAISKGKISMKSTKDIEIEDCVDSMNYVINLKFLAKKVGSSDIRLHGDSRYAAGGGPIDVKLKSTITEQTCPKCEQTECPTVEEKECPEVEEKECPVCKTPEITICPQCHDSLYLVIIGFLGFALLVVICLMPIMLAKQKKKLTPHSDAIPPENKE